MAETMLRRRRWRGVLYEKSGLSQETLKIIACVTMLIDHVGATVVESQFL